MNNSFLQATEAEKYATIFYTLGLYLKLLVFPNPLTFDYYPYHIALTDWSNIISLVSFFTYIILVVLMVIFFRKKNIICIAIALYLIPLAPVSNIFFPIGVFMNERFLFISSVGFCLLLGFYLVKAFLLGKKWPYIIYLLLPLILILYGFKTIERNKAWFNDYTLFTTDVRTSYNSAKSNCSAGGALLESSDTIVNIIRKKEFLKQSVSYLKRAVAIHPRYADAWLLLGNAYFKLGNNFDSAVYCYTNILKDAPQHQLAIKNIIAVGENMQNADGKIEVFKLALTYDPLNYMVNYRLGQLYGKEKNDLDKSILFLTKATELKPDFLDGYIDLGVAYGFKKEFAKSAAMLEKAVTINPHDANIFMNLGLTYKFMGNIEKASQCFYKSDSLKRLK
jgi:tetratricopeptide (TPR) repeat protein